MDACVVTNNGTCKILEITDLEFLFYRLFDEIESLEAILMDDVRISKNAETGAPEIMETTIFPVVEEETEQQYICVNLQVTFVDGYPEVSPKFNLLKPRGLDDNRLDKIRVACVTKLKETQGYPVVFDLIEVVREHLSGSNLPCGQCVVCLYGFREGDEFTKTECYHYLHSYCLERHLVAARKNYQEEQDKLPAWIRKASEPFRACCPVCREPIKDESSTLKNCLPPAELNSAPDFQLTDELINLQHKMAKLFSQQKQRGGIIDVEAEIGPVISIEPSYDSVEEHVRNNGDNSIEYFKDETPSLDQNGIKKSECLAETSMRNQKPTNAKRGARANCDLNRAEANCSTNFAPVVAATQRIAADPTNNNYHHNLSRRQMRGRRHQNHQRCENNTPNHPLSPGQSSSQPNSNRHQKSYGSTAR